MSSITTFNYKLPRSQEAKFVVYPNAGSNVFTCQSNKRILRADLDLNVMVLSKSGKTTFMDLNQCFGAKIMELPEDLKNILTELKESVNCTHIELF